ncbi:DUF3467 domain-containing protein [bacterium]|nr:MAG: DUF3467 domain-containing protein [bacterium]
MNQDPKQPQQLEIELTEQEANGTYANLAMITHSPSEFVLDFIAVMPGVPKARVVKRMILTPDHAKRLMNALQDNVRKFEDQFGPINAKDRPEFPMNFRGPIPEA